MKKIIYAVLFAFASTLTFTACTEEEVAPNTEGAPAAGADIIIIDK